MTNYTGAGISFPDGIVTGPDGALWFTNDNPGGSIGRITTAGTVTNYSAAIMVYPKQIVVGPDGALWFTTINDLVWRITTAGNLTSYPGGYNSYGIAVGPDGALWTANGSGSSGWIGRITTTGTMTSYPVLPDGFNPNGITAGPDGAMWFTNWNGSAIGRITASVTPEIFDKSPTSGAPGTQVTISGSNLSGATAVTFKGTPASIVSDTARQLVTSVPAGADHRSYYDNHRRGHRSLPVRLQSDLTAAQAASAEALTSKPLRRPTR